MAEYIEREVAIAVIEEKQKELFPDEVKDYPPYLDHPKKRKKRKKQTNADKYFRNATDEELAEWLAEHQKIGDAETHRDGYRQLWLDWLKQEVEIDGKT